MQFRKPAVDHAIVAVRQLVERNAIGRIEHAVEWLQLIRGGGFLRNYCVVRAHAKQHIQHAKRRLFVMDFRRFLQTYDLGPGKPTVLRQKRHQQVG
ncbi:hypothetical protein D3C81_1247030 [compost metagenome]